jgi:DsbE subfamily thiol:disulfide oxidoreductase
LLYSSIGYYALILGLGISLILVYFSIKNFQNSSTLNTKILSFTFLQFFLVVISFACLIISFVLSDFSNETVFNNSHTTKPLFYKIAGTWGNHEGSLLLWLLVLTLFILIFFLKTKNQPLKYKLLTLIFQQIIIIGFFLFLIQTSNPFNFIFPTPEEGMGLNPILQDPALAIHPPILYLGYVGSSIIFSSALAATYLNLVSKVWASHIKKWIIASWVFLTLGILLGSIWAYYELGWGGFWFWDPVENVSLMPWLALTTLLHCIIVLEKKQVLTSWVIILSISTFTLSMCGTFLVRSGILNSVHTFANDPERGLFILQNTNIYTPETKISNKIPSFKGDLFYSDETINSSNFFNSDKFYLLNVWSSWCVPCRKEHTFLMNFKESKKIEVVGINYKDKKINAENFLIELGNPYKKIIFDQEGIIAIEWGAYGVPETFLIKDKVIIKRYIGPLDEKTAKEI